MSFLRLLPPAKDFIDREQVYFWKVSRIFLRDLFKARTVMIPSHNLLSFRTVKILQISFSQCFGALPFGDFIDYRNRWFCQYAYAGSNNLKLALTDFFQRKNRFVLPGDQHFANSSLHKSRGCPACAPT